MEGLLNVDKPAGQTSYRTVARIKRLTGERRVGHAGTLDPDATGVLPICLGKATRVVEYLTGASKTYRAGIELGTATDTYDASGKVMQRGDTSGIDRAKIEAALDRFRGVIYQVPPMYSALKHQGQPLYKLARAGISIERKSRAITIYRLEMTDWQPPQITLEVECSKGTYIRSLAHDLGQALGCGAHLKNLVRTCYGPFDIKDAVSLSQLEDACREGHLERFLFPVDYVLRDFDAVVIDEAAEKSLRQGSPLTLEDSGAPHIKENQGEVRRRAYSQEKHFLGIIRYVPDKDVWQPEKLF